MEDVGQAVAFLERVWGDREGYVDLPSKTNGHWIPFNMEWPNKKLARKRIESCLEDGEDVYFSVAQFSSKGRRIGDVMPTSWLWADLDEVPPAELIRAGVRPTISWESSPGRFQALWQLEETLKPHLQEQLNRLLSYKIGADRGGWDLTQVLRPPGTKNHKYSEPVEVSILWDDGPVYSAKKIYRKVKLLPEPPDMPRPVTGKMDVMGGSGHMPNGDAIALKNLPARVRRLLTTPEDMVVPGERSSRLWELECRLAELGMDEGTIFNLVHDTPWNKWRELHTGDDRLRQDIRKAIGKVRSDQRNGGSSGDVEVSPSVSPPSEEDESTRPLPFVAYADFLSTHLEAPRWLIDDIWGASSHGFIGGEPKTSKSTLAFAMAVSVASGRPFLGQYPVRTTGPVLLVQEENAAWMVQDRLRKIARSYKLIRPSEYEEVVSDDPGVLASKITRLSFPREIPLFVLNNYGFNITVEADREALEAAIQEIRPALVILDPLYLVAAGANLNNSLDVTPLLQWILYLRFTYNCAVVIIHHMHKASDVSGMRRAGQRLMGSGLFHGFVESALYAEALDPEGDWTKIRVEREFRNTAPQKPLEVSLRMGEPGSLDFEANIKQFDATGELLTIVEQSPGITLAALAEMIGSDKRTARNKANEAGCVLKGGKRGRGHSWSVYPPGTVIEEDRKGEGKGAKER